MNTHQRRAASKWAMVILAGWLFLGVIGTGRAAAQQAPAPEPAPGKEHHGGEWRGHGKGPRMRHGRRPGHGRRGEVRKFFNRLMGMSPEEQNRELAANPRFQQLPPERQERIRRRLERWNSFPPEKKQQIRERRDILMGLGRAQRRRVRELYGRWREFPPERRSPLHEAFRQLKLMKPQERERYLAGPDAAKQFSPDELQLLSGMARVLPDEAERPEPPPTP